MWWCLGGAAVTVAILLLAWRLDPVRRLEAELAAREPLPDAELAARFFPAGDVPAEVPAVVRRVFAGHTNYPAEKLLPDDDLVFSVVGDVVALVAELEEGFGVVITDAEAGRTACTIRAVSLLIARKRAEPGAAPDRRGTVGF